MKILLIVGLALLVGCSSEVSQERRTADGTGPDYDLTSTGGDGQYNPCDKTQRVVLIRSDGSKHVENVPVYCAAVTPDHGDPAPDGYTKQNVNPEPNERFQLQQRQQTR